MRVELVRVDELDASSAQRWDAIRRAERSLASPFYSLDFARVVASQRAVRVALIEVDGELVGFWAHEPNRLGMAVPLAWPLSDHHGPVVRSGLRLPVRELMRRCKMLGFRFSALPAQQQLFAEFHAGCAGSPIVYLDRVALSNQSRKRNALRRAVGEPRFEADCRDARVLDRLIGWKRGQLERTRVDDFTSLPGTVELLHALHRYRGDELRGRLSVLWAGETPVAAHFGPTSPRVWHWWFPAYDPQFARHSPGLLMLHELLRAAHSEGAEWLDFGTGEEPFKWRLAHDTLNVARGTAFTSVGRAAFMLKQHAQGALAQARQLTRRG
jgi:CelD/BcsL family acetyltransferase involved in cellulose biosynthesis